MILDPYIKIESEKNEQGLILFRFVCFNLDKISIQKILQARNRRQGISISKHLLAQLRHYALSDGENSKGENRFQSALTFCTYYDYVSEIEAVKVMRSAISLDGNITHQIRQDCLKDTTTCLAIATSHYWLIEQLLKQLRIKPTPSWRWISWGLSFVIVAVLVILYAHNLVALNPLFWLAPVVMWWLLQEGIRRLLRLFVSVGGF